MVYSSSCPYCGHKDLVDNAGYVRCTYCQCLYELSEPINFYSSKRLPKYKLLELGENITNYGYREV